MARPKHPQETRQRLLAAADEVFYAHGIRNSSVDEVAQRAGLTKRTLYYHFPSKDNLAAAYGLDLPYRRDSRETGFPDVLGISSGAGNP